MAKDDVPQKAKPSQLVSKKSPAQEPAKKMSPGEEMESEWQQIVDYYDPVNVGKRAEEARKKELQALQSAMEANREQEQILEDFYGIKPRPKQSLEELERAAAEVAEEDEWNFPQDPDKWTEADLGEEWAEAPPDAKVPFYDPLLGLSALDAADDDADADDGRRRRKAPRKQQRAKLPHSEDRYVPYRQGLPPVNEMDDGSSGALRALEELEMEEEFLQWASYVFRDGATYEGTVWNDMAQGKGVYTTPLELCKYEGEWVQNMMQGHGVLSVDVPARLPPPDSEAWRKLKAEGKVFEDAEMSAEDREWLRMELEDLSQQETDAKKATAAAAAGDGTLAVADPTDAVPFEDHPGWLKVYGRKPEKGHYEYAGQMKQNKFHGCGVFTLNGRMHFGKFRFGEFLRNKDECDAHTSGFHAGMARVAAAKARMFVNKPDGMVREVKGPYNEPSHPYLYDDDDMWQAPGFIHEFHEVPPVWKRYAEEVDGERQLWLNSFKKAPLRLPSPSELSYLWDQDEEFVVLRNTPRLPERAGESAEEEEMRRADMQGEVLVHVPTRQIINWTTDDEGKLRLFVQPFPKDGKVDPSKARPLPLGFDEFIKGEEMEEEEDEDEDEEESEEARRLKTPEQLQRDAERRRAKAAEARRRKVARWERSVRNQAASRREKREEEWAQQDAEEEELRQLEEDEWEREGDLMEAEFEARLDAAEGILPEGGEEEDAEEGEGEGKAGEEGVAAGGTKAAAAAAGSVKAAGGGAGEEEESESESDDDDDDDDEEERKPRSFGTVAMAGSEGREEGMAGEGWLRGPAAGSSTTVFASISLSSQVALQHALHHAARSISSLRRLLPSVSPAAPPAPSATTASLSLSSTPAASPSLPPPAALAVRMPAGVPLLPSLRASALSASARHAPLVRSSSHVAARVSKGRQQQQQVQQEAGTAVGSVLSLALPLPATPSHA
ncbi:hypothetical protein CLOM_g10910 [Closterium sp. NIES-68]|nr:hypothetical protein CLOM_g10910 [Closterium sp. NIES-68]GJP57773.1 hypothetical protein CLOP_g17368 [Closterium sp. NIES-67]GJP84190.1 hypothetical protein CLOP_g14278 [Closterium sp. NIES-67]